MAHPPDAIGVCAACSESSKIAECSTRADGFAECPACGGTVEIVAQPLPSEQKDAKPEKRWCGECGAEWAFKRNPEGTRPEWSFFINCGHTSAIRIDDPRKAKQIKPPAGLQTRTSAEVEKRDAEDAKRPDVHDALDRATTLIQRSKRVAEMREASKGAAEHEPANRLSLKWGEARMPVDRFNSFSCGGHIVTIDLAPGEDRVEAARQIANELQQIADELFERQKRWYLQKLGILEKATGE